MLHRFSNLLCAEIGVYLDDNANSENVTTHKQENAVDEDAVETNDREVFTNNEDAVVANDQYDFAACNQDTALADDQRFVFFFIQDNIL
jgi:hypothetical protein